MSVAGIGSGLSGVGSFQGPGSLGSTQSQQSTATTALPTQEGSRLSKRGQFLNRLQELAKSDPAQAKDLLNQLADKFRAQAQAGGPGSDRRLALADRIQQAADSGDYSSLEPGSGQGKGQGGGSPATQAYAATQAWTQSSR